MQKAKDLDLLQAWGSGSGLWRQDHETQTMEGGERSVETQTTEEE